VSIAVQRARRKPNGRNSAHNPDLIVTVFDKLKADLRWLRGEDGVVANSEALNRLAQVLAPLLAAEGLTLLAIGDETRRKADATEQPWPASLPRLHSSRDIGVDLVASRSLDVETSEVAVGIQYKHHGRGNPIGVAEVRHVIRTVADWPGARAMLIGRFGFTSDARETASRKEPVAVELLDLTGIDAWIRRVELGQPANTNKVQILLRSISHEFAQLVATDARWLDELEWRDLERMIARVMEGLGFATTLTPPSKDGGKDLVLVCEVKDGEESFIVELKHWRSGKRVGRDSVADFLRVIVSENRSGGLFLSTSGYAADTFEGLTEVTRNRLRLGGRNKVVVLAQTYMRACQGLWSPPTVLPEVLFEHTL
jgi:restriction system protein